MIAKLGFNVPLGEQEQRMILAGIARAASRLA
jgi:hypothetical protein